MTAILEQDLTKLKLEQLIGYLITHEMITSGNDKKKKIDLALKVSNANEDHEDDEDEEIAFLSRKFRRFLTHKKEGT